MASVQQQYLESRTGPGGTVRVYITGTRIRVQDIACEHEFEGLSPAQIAREFPQLTLGQIHAALAYFFDHRDEILAEIQGDAAQANVLRAELGQPAAGSDAVRDAPAP